MFTPTATFPSHNQFTRQAARGEQAGPCLSVVVPVYNEAATIDELLRRVDQVPVDKEVLVVDDGSTDGTADILEHWKSVPGFSVLVHEENRGKGAAVRAALKSARGTYVIVQDGDLETDPGEYPQLLAPLLSGEADAVFGTRFSRSPAGSFRRRVLFRMGVALLNRAVRMLYGLQISDEACCYKVFPRSVLNAMDLTCRRFELCPELVAKACRMQLRVVEVPVHYVPRDHVAGKKIRYRDGLFAMGELWKWRRWQPAEITDAPQAAGYQRNVGSDDTPREPRPAADPVAPSPATRLPR